MRDVPLEENAMVRRISFCLVAVLLCAIAGCAKTQQSVPPSPTPKPTLPPPEAVSWLREAFAETKQIDKDFDKMSAFHSIMEADTRAGLYEDALAAMNEMEEDTDRPRELGQLALALVDSADREQAGKYLPDVIAAIQRITDARKRFALMRGIALAEAKAGMLAEAVKSAEETANPRETLQSMMSSVAREQKLADVIALAQASGKPYAMDDAHEACATAEMAAGRDKSAADFASQINAPLLKADICRQIAENWAVGGDDKMAASMFDGAVAAVKEIPGDGGKAAALKVIAISQVKADMVRQARDTVALIQDEEKRDAATEALEDWEGMGKYFAAKLNAVRKLAPSINQITRMLQIAADQQSNGYNKGAAATLAVAARSAASLWPAYVKDLALNLVLEARLRSLRNPSPTLFSSAPLTWEEAAAAKAIARQMSSPVYKARALGVIASHENGDNQLDTLHEALWVARNMEADADKDSALADVIHHLALIGAYDDANAAMSEILNAEIKDDLWKLLESQATGPDEISRLIDTAYPGLGDVFSTDFRKMFMEKIKAGQLDYAAMLTADLDKVAKGIALTALAAAYAGNGQSDKAAACLDEAFAAAQTVKESEMAAAMTRLAVWNARLGRMDKVAECARQLEGSWEKSHLFSEVAYATAKFGSAEALEATYKSLAKESPQVRAHFCIGAAEGILDKAGIAKVQLHTIFLP
jgi:hypothetical protein